MAWLLLPGLWPNVHEAGLAQPLKARVYFSRAIGQKGPDHAIAKSLEASLSLSSPPFIKLLLCSKQLHAFSLILRIVVQGGES